MTNIETKHYDSEIARVSENNRKPTVAFLPTTIRKNFNGIIRGERR